MKAVENDFLAFLCDWINVETITGRCVHTHDLTQMIVCSSMNERMIRPQPDK